MKKTLMCATAAAAFAGTGFVAQADDGWYGRADVGVITDANTFDHDAEAGIPFTLGGDSEVEDGYLGSLGFGYAFDNGFRLEAALTGRDGQLDPKDGTNGVGLPADIIGVNEQIIYSRHKAGNFSSIDLMVNALYDFNREGRFQPYLGAGIGVAQVDARARNIAATFANGAGIPTRSVGANGFDDSETSLAVQALAGFGYGLTDQLSLDLGLRAFSVQDMELEGVNEIGNSISYDATYNDLSVTAGLRY
ncbi:MAG: outer membrane beta-barrel protein, partial [Pseudomonadota bacterium]